MRKQSSAFQDYQSQKYFANLDGLRFICIAMVLWHHSQPIAPGTYTLADRGFLGVDFFFVLSGFLITTLLKREGGEKGNFSILKFYQRRILRIMPVYFFVVSMVGLYFWLVKGIEVGHLLPYYYLFLSNFLPEHLSILAITWSLSVEEQFYLIWPLALLLLPSRYLVSALIFAITTNVIFGAGWISLEAPAIGQLRIALPNSTYAPILMGALLAIVANTPRGHAVLYNHIGKRWSAPSLLILLVVILQVLPEDVSGFPNFAIHSCMTIVLASLVLRKDTFLSRILQTPLIARIGVISYGIYLYHMIARDLTVRVFTTIGIEHEWLQLIVYSITSIIIAEISFRTLEAYFRRFRPAG